MNEQNLLDRLESAKRRISTLEAENNKLTNDVKSKKGLISSLNIQQRKIRFVLAYAIDLIPDGYDRIEALQALADDCKHL